MKGRRDEVLPDRNGLLLFGLEPREFSKEKERGSVKRREHEKAKGREKRSPRDTHGCLVPSESFGTCRLRARVFSHPFEPLKDASSAKSCFMYNC